MSSVTDFITSTSLSNPEGGKAELHPDQVVNSMSSTSGVIEPSSPLLASPFTFPDGWDISTATAQPTDRSINQSMTNSHPDPQADCHVSEIKITDGHKGKGASGEIMVEWTRHWSGHMKIPLRLTERTRFRIRITCEPEDPRAYPINNGLDITPYFNITIDPANQTGMFSCNDHMWNGLIQHPQDCSSYLSNNQPTDHTAFEFEFEMDQDCDRIMLTGEMHRPITSFEDRMNTGSPMILRVEVLHDVLPRVCGEVKFSGWNRAATKKATKRRTSAGEGINSSSEVVKRACVGDSC